MSLYFPPLHIENVFKYYGTLRALNNVSLELKKGEILGLLGPNGAGKTTLISLVTTMEPPSKGEISVFGYNVQTQGHLAKSCFGIVPQETIGHGFFSLLEVLTFISGYHGLSKNKEKIHWCLKKLGLWDHREKKVSQLSGGMKRRFLIAKALVHSPKLLLLDEPTAGVDVELRSELWKFVEELNQEGMTILLTTHYLEEAEKLCHRVALIHQGEISPPQETLKFIHQFTHKTVSITFSSHFPVDSFSCSSPYFKYTEQELNKMIFQLPASTPVGALLSSLAVSLSDITDLSVQEGNLEQAFLAAIGKKTEE